MRVIFLQREVQRCEEKKFSASVRTSPAKVHAREKMSFTKQHEAKEIVYIYIYPPNCTSQTLTLVFHLRLRLCSIWKMKKNILIYHTGIITNPRRDLDLP